MTTVRGRLVPVGDAGKVIGEDHHNAKLTDVECELMRTMYEAGGIGYRKLAKIFKCHPATVQGIVKYRRRNRWPDYYKRVDK